MIRIEHCRVWTAMSTAADEISPLLSAPVTSHIHTLISPKKCDHRGNKKVGIWRGTWGAVWASLHSNESETCIFGWWSCRPRSTWGHKALPVKCQRQSLQQVVYFCRRCFTNYYFELSSLCDILEASKQSRSWITSTLLHMRKLYLIHRIEVHMSKRDSF